MGVWVREVEEGGGGKGGVLPNIAQLAERPTVEACRNRAVPGSNPGVRMLFILFILIKQLIITRQFQSQYKSPLVIAGTAYCILPAPPCTSDSLVTALRCSGSSSRTQAPPPA